MMTSVTISIRQKTLTLAISGAVKRGEIGTTVTATPKLPKSTGPY